VPLKAIAGAVPLGVGGSIVSGYTNNSGTPGNTTINTPSGRAAIAAAATACVVTCSACLATSKVFVTLESADATLLYVKQVTVAAGSFTVTGVAAATGSCTFSFLVVN
jgi:hypothetical protein